MTKDKSRIQSCVDHINTAADVDPWAKELVAEMGKEILKAQLSKEDATSDLQQTCNQLATDCISRQEAIRIASGYCHFTNVTKELEKLPSVQPVDKDINVSCKDAISRQGAIDAFLTELTKRERKNLLHTWSTVEVKYFVADMLEKLPSVQPDIIHCKDCKHWREGTAFSFCDKLHGMGVLAMYDYMKGADDYCSMAEREDDEPN